MNRIIRAPDLITDTDLCVKCGLCLPHCPSYGITQDENESPRGRIALIQGWAQGELEAGKELRAHINHCLLCRACESACPAKVPYADIIDRFRARQHGALKGALFLRLRQSLISLALKTQWSPWLNHAILRLGRSRPGTWVAAALGLLPVTRGLPDLQEPPRTFKDHLQEDLRSDLPSQKVQFFKGCSAGLLDFESVKASLNLLNRLGFPVETPQGQGCCGALDLHAGNDEETQRLIKNNVLAFTSKTPSPILGCASGCGGTIKEYPAAQSNLSSRYQDISDFLTRIDWPAEIQITELQAVAVLHTPCTLKNVLKTPKSPLALAQKIPGLKIIELADNTGCCGAAGSFMIEHPVEARAYREQVLDRILKTAPDYLLTSNPGCALHLRAGLRERGLNAIEVLHPVTLVSRQVADNGHVSS